MRFPEDAACLGKPQEWFYPEEGSRKGKLPPIARRALALCATCPVQAECLAYALANDEFTFSVRGDGQEPENILHHLEGIWAGTTFQERKATRHLKLEARVALLRDHASARYRRLGLSEAAREFGRTLYHLATRDEEEA